jgi:hypothetical protein
MANISMDELIGNVNSVCFQDAERVLRYLNKHSEFLCKAAETLVDDKGSELSHAIHAIAGDSQYFIALVLLLKTQANAPINLERTSFFSDTLVFFRQISRCGGASVICADRELSSYFHVAIFDICGKVIEMARRRGLVKSILGPLLRLFTTIISQPEKLTSMHAMMMEVTKSHVLARNFVT